MQLPIYKLANAELIIPINCIALCYTFVLQKTTKGKTNQIIAYSIGLYLHYSFIYKFVFR